MAIITSTIGTTGRTYSTLQAWEDALPADIVASGNSYVGECYKDSEFTGAAPVLTISGSTTDSTHTITLKCGSGQSFYDNTNKLTNALRYNASNGVGIRSTSGFLNRTLEVSSQYVTLDDLQICMDFGSATGNIYVSGASFTVKNVIGQVTASDGNASNVFNLTVAGQITNCLAVQETTGSGGRGFSFDSSSVIATNCQAIRTQNTNTTAYDNGYSAPLIRNCLSLGFANFTRGSGFPLNASSDYNATDLPVGTYLGAGTHHVRGLTASATIESITAGSVDARTKSGASTINAGFRDNTYTTDLDIVNQARSTSTPTIGVWEYISSTQTYSYTGSGGFVLSGTGPIVKQAYKTPTGGLIFSGTANPARGAARTTSGGLTLGGASTVLRGMVKTATGGILFSGVAGVSFFNGVQSLTVIASGGIIFSGAATKLRNVVRTCSGGIIFGGSATIVEFPDPNPTTQRHRKRGRRPRQKI